jgi:hypothetical protein
MNMFISSILRASLRFFFETKPINKSDKICVKLFFVMELVDKVLHAMKQ